MQKSTKKQYVTPDLKEHGVVRELTQSGSGGRPDKNKNKHKHKNKNPKKNK
jgi:hypothetical protein